MTGPIEMERKQSTSVTLKSGQGLAQVWFAQPDGRTIDGDRDITLPGAWPDGAVVAVSPWGHRSVTHGEIPAGRAVMWADGTADLKLFMETQAGRDTFVAMNELRDEVEMSYGFIVLELGELTAEMRQRGARRVLKKLDVLECSPVLRGAAASSGVLSIKAAPFKPDAKLVKAVKRAQAYAECLKERHGSLAWHAAQCAARWLSNGAMEEGPAVKWFDNDGKRAGYWIPGADEIHINRVLGPGEIVRVVGHETEHWWAAWDPSEARAKAAGEYVARRYQLAMEAA